tara:strand:+ start:1837 stop:2142 length:306 start_codon:yes stop_codon:yes gene_type:complete
MNIEKMSYTEAKWWILNNWKFIEKKASEHYKKDVLLLYCEKTKDIFFADKKTEEPIYTMLYKERNKKPTYDTKDIYNGLVEAVKQKDKIYDKIIKNENRKS